MQYDYLDAKLGKALVAAVGLRNMLIHEYVRIDVERLYGFLALAEDFSRFVESVEEYL